MRSVTPKPKNYIAFVDPVVAQICADTWGDGVGLTYEQAATITDLGTVFCNNTSIVSFDELQFFTSLSTITTYAFTSCTNLASVVLRSGLTAIGNGAFSGCSSLNTVNLPSTIVSIGDYAFTGSGLRTLTVNGNPRFSVGMRAFQRCSSLASFPFECVTSIGVEGFTMAAITSIYAPNLTTIGSGAFNNCDSLIDIVSLGSVTSVPSYMANYSNTLASVKLPETVTSIGYEAFYRSNMLRRVVIPKSVTQFDGEAFQTNNNPNADKVYIMLASTPPSVSVNVFHNYAGSYEVNKVKIYVPYSDDHSILNAYKTTGNWTTYANCIYELTDLVPAEYRRLTGIVFDGNVWYDTGMPLRGSDTVKISFSATKACNVFGCYTTGSAEDNYSLYVSTTSSEKYLRYNGSTYSSYIAANTRYDVTITPTGTDGMRTDSTWTAKTFTCPVNMLIGSTSVGATSAKFTGTLYGELEVVGRAIFIPVERIADGEIGYYNPVTDEFLTNESTGTPTALGYA